VAQQVDHGDGIPALAGDVHQALQGQAAAPAILQRPEEGERFVQQGRGGGGVAPGEGRLAQTDQGVAGV
jgi:hypothetical protein